MVKKIRIYAMNRCVCSANQCALAMLSVTENETGPSPTGEMNNPFSLVHFYSLSRLCSMDKHIL